MQGFFYAILWIGLMGILGKFCRQGHDSTMWKMVPPRAWWYIVENGAARGMVARYMWPLWGQANINDPRGVTHFRKSLFYLNLFDSCTVLSSFLILKMANIVANRPTKKLKTRGVLSLFSAYWSLFINRIMIIPVIYNGITNQVDRLIWSFRFLYMKMMIRLTKAAMANTKCSHIPNRFMDIKPAEIAPNSKKRVWILCIILQII